MICRRYTGKCARSIDLHGTREISVNVKDDGIGVAGGSQDRGIVNVLRVAGVLMYQGTKVVPGRLADAMGNERESARTDAP